MNVTRSGALGGDNETSETITLREITNKARERIMKERMEKMETLTAILNEMRNERRKDYDNAVTGEEAAAEPSHQRHRNEGIPSLGGRPERVHAYRDAVRTLGEHGNEERDQFHSGRVPGSDGRRANAQENDLR